MMAAVSHALSALMVSEKAVFLLAQEVQPVIHALLALHGVDPAVPPREQTPYVAHYGAEFLKARHFIVLLLFRESHIYMNQELLVQNGAYQPLLVSLETQRYTPTECTAQTPVHHLRGSTGWRVGAW